ERERAQSRTWFRDDHAYRRDGPRANVIAAPQVLHAEILSVRLMRVGREPDVAAVAREGLRWHHAQPAVGPRVQFLRRGQRVRLADDDGPQARDLGAELAVVLQQLSDHGVAPVRGAPGTTRMPRPA